MTRSQVAALAIALLAVVGAGGAAWWLHANHQMPALAERLATLSGERPSAQAPSARGPQTASREAPSGPTPIGPPGPAKPSIAPPPAPSAESAHPSFDIVRVEPHGDTVVAGKGAPNANVALMSGGKVVGETKTDANGQFVILPPPLAPGDYDLTLRQEPENGKPARESAQSVAVSVPKPGKGSVVVALAEPGKATKLLSAPPGAPATRPGSAPPSPGNVAIRSAELENGSGFFVSGSAKTGAPVHVYLNDAHIADVVAGADGGWSVRVKKGLTGGHYVVRADVGGGSGRAVASRAEVPFDVPVAMAAPAAKVASASPTPATQTAPAPDVTTAPSVAGAATTSNADAVLDSIATARVTTGDNLWNISRFRLGDGKRYTQIYAANADQIRDPDLIYPGQVFVVPAR